MRSITTVLLVFITTAFLFGQAADTLPPVFDYSEPGEYEIGGMKVLGSNFSDENAIKSIAGLKVGDKIRIPGEDIPGAVKSLWKLRLFTDVQIYQEKVIGDIIFLEIRVKERPRLTRFSYKGIKKSYHEDLNELVNKYLLRGGIVTDNVKQNAVNEIKDFFREKGYYDTEVTVQEITDEKSFNAVRLVFEIDRNEKVKIQDIVFVGNTTFPNSKLRKRLKNTRRKRKVLSKSRYQKQLYEEDKQTLVTFYNNKGYRDMLVAEDSIWRGPDGHLRIQLTISEGQQYFFRNITWKGNSIYTGDFLSHVLGIQKGDIYNQELLENRLRFSMDGRDVSSLYMDNGYLFFNVDPVEVAIAGDSIDLEMRMFEGPQATIDRVVITGNDRTHEHVIRRELRTRPGQKFSRSDIIRSQREIINLGYFNPETIGVNTPVNPQRGTVDIEYSVEEKPSSHPLSA